MLIGNIKILNYIIELLLNIRISVQKSDVNCPDEWNSFVSSGCAIAALSKAFPDHFIKIYPSLSQILIDCDNLETFIFLFNLYLIVGGETDFQEAFYFLLDNISNQNIRISNESLLTFISLLKFFYSENQEVEEEIIVSSLPIFYNLLENNHPFNVCYILYILADICKYDLSPRKDIILILFNYSQSNDFLISHASIESLFHFFDNVDDLSSSVFLLEPLINILYLSITDESISQADYSELLGLILKNCTIAALPYSQEIMEILTSDYKIHFLIPLSLSCLYFGENIINYTSKVLNTIIYYLNNLENFDCLRLISTSIINISSNPHSLELISNIIPIILNLIKEFSINIEYRGILMLIISACIGLSEEFKIYDNFVIEEIETFLKLYPSSVNCEGTILCAYLECLDSLLDENILDILFRLVDRAIISNDLGEDLCEDCFDVLLHAYLVSESSFLNYITSSVHFKFLLLESQKFKNLEKLIEVHSQIFNLQIPN